MDRLAFTSLAAVQSASQIRAQITHDMANVSTVGFKESYQVAARAVKIDGDGYDTRFQPAVKARDIISLEPGVLTQTGNPMDVSFYSISSSSIRIFTGTNSSGFFDVQGVNLVVF